MSSRMARAGSMRKMKSAVRKGAVARAFSVPAMDDDFLARTESGSRVRRRSSLEMGAAAEQELASVTSADNLLEGEEIEAGASGVGGQTGGKAGELGAGRDSDRAGKVGGGAAVEEEANDQNEEEDEATTANMRDERFKP